MGSLFSCQSNKHSSNDDSIMLDPDLEARIFSNYTPLASLQHRTPPEIHFCKNTPFTVLLEMQPDLLRFVFAFLRSETVYMHFRSLCHYTHYLINHQVDLYFMNQFLCPRMLKGVHCERIRSMRVSVQDMNNEGLAALYYQRSSGIERTTTYIAGQFSHPFLNNISPFKMHSKELQMLCDWLKRNGSHLKELELDNFAFHISDSSALHKVLKLTPNLEYLVLNDKNSWYTTEFFQNLSSKPHRIRHLALRNREVKSFVLKPSPVSELDPRVLSESINELTLHSIRINQKTVDNLVEWINDPHRLVKGFHLLKPCFPPNKPDLSPLFKALTEKQTLKRMSVPVTEGSSMFDEPLWVLSSDENQLIASNSRLEKLLVQDDTPFRSLNRVCIEPLMNHLGKLSSLKSLTIRGRTYVPETTFRTMTPLTRDSKLTKISICGNSVFPWETYASIVAADCNVRSVRLQGCCIRSKQVNYEFENEMLSTLNFSFMENFSAHLRRIAASKIEPKIHHLSITNSKATEADVSAVIQKCSRLANLNLKAFEDSSRNALGMPIIESIRSHPSLREVNICRCTFTLPAFLQLHRILENPNLETLSMDLVLASKLPINDFCQAVVQWKEAIVNHPHIQKISVHGFGGSFYRVEIADIMEREWSSIRNCDISIGKEYD